MSDTGMGVRARPGRAGVMAAAAAIGALCAAAGTAAAQTDVYIAEYQFNAAQVSAVRADGTNPRTLFALPAAQWLPIGLTFNPGNGRLYWTDSAGASEIVSALPTGAGNTVVASFPGFGRGASLDAQGRVYFSSNNTLRRVNADGTGLTTLYTDASSNPLGQPRVDATNGRVYVGANGRIISLDLNGGALRTVVEGVSQPRAIGLDVGAGFIYWADGDTITDFVGRSRLDGTEFTVLVDITPGVVGSSGLSDLLVAPGLGRVFFANELAGVVRSATLAGAGVTTLFTSAPGKSPSGLTLSTGEPPQPVLDCNTNGVPDVQEIAAGAPDCDNNGIIDTCQVNPCPQRVFLLNNGTDPANTQGRAVGVPSQWQIFQPFDVPAGGWTIGEIGLDGFTSNFADGSGMTVRIFPDNGSGQQPSETGPALASATLNLRFNTFRENWVYAPLDVTLPAGRFWARLEANAPTVFGASVNFGTSGPQSRSRGSSGTFSGFVGPVALRLVQRVTPPTCRPDLNSDGELTFDDIQLFVALYNASDARADFNNDGEWTFDDIQLFVQLYNAGC